MSRDPIGYVDQPHFYDYVSGSPANATDPFGLCQFVVEFAGEQIWWCKDIGFFIWEGSTRVKVPRPPNFRRPCRKKIPYAPPRPKPLGPPPPPPPPPCVKPNPGDNYFIPATPPVVGWIPANINGCYNGCPGCNKSAKGGIHSADCMMCCSECYKIHKARCLIFPAHKRCKGAIKEKSLKDCQGKCL